MTGRPPAQEGRVLTCVRCGCSMLRGQCWPRPTGVRRHMGRGLCMNCYHVRSTSPTGNAGSRTAPADEVVVERVISGNWHPMNLAERLAVVAYFAEHGIPAAEIARRTRLAQRSVHRLRRRIRTEVAA